MRTYLLFIIALGRLATASEVEFDVSISADECYVGQPFVATGMWRSKLQFHRFRAVEIDVPLFYNDAFRLAAPEPEPDDASGRFLSLPVSNARIIAERTKTDTDDGQYGTLRFKRVVVPLRPGTFTLAPSTLKCVAVPAEMSKPRQVPSYFNNSFFEQPEGDTATKHVAQSTPLTLTVKPLPEAGRPADFTGIVGACIVSSAAEPAAVRTGEPVTLTVTVSGHPFPRTVRLPALDGQPAFARNFGLPGKPPACRAVDGKSVFAVDLRPLRPDVSEIPPVRVSFFDPVAQRYDVARSEAIPIIVAESATTTAFDADLSGETQLRNPLIANRDGIRHNVNAEAAVTTRRRSPGVLLGTMVAIPPLLFLLFLTASARHRLAHRDPAAARARAALGRFRRQMKSLCRTDGAESADRQRMLGNAMRAYFADRLGLAVQATCDEILAELTRRGSCDDGQASIERIYRACDRQRFAKEPEPIDDRALVAQATDAIQRIEGALRRATRLVFAPLVLGALAACMAPAVADEPDSLTICREANALFADANQAALSDPDQAKALYQRAALRYQYLIAERGLDSALLHGNLGNACFFGGDIGQAITHYHRALRRNPHDGDVRHNLRYVRSLCIDELPRSGWRRVLATATFWHGWPLSVRTLLFCTCHVATWVLAAFLLYRTTRLRWWALGVGATVSVVFLTSVIVTVFRLDERVDGVIVAKEVTARHGDGHIYESAFASPLHAGTEFSLVERRDRWHHIALLDGSPCWVPAHSVALIE